MAHKALHLHDESCLVLAEAIATPLTGALGFGWFFVGEEQMAKMVLAWMALALGLTFPHFAQAQIKIGVAGDMSGPGASFGAEIRSGVEQAVEDINARGGINGQRLMVIVGDDASDPRRGVQVALQLANEGVKFVVGHFSSSVSIPASQVYEEAGIVQVTPGSTSPVFTERGMWNLFRTCGRDDQQGIIAGNYFAEAYRGKRVAIIHDRTPYGEALAARTRSLMNAGGLGDFVYTDIDRGTSDFSSLMSRLRDADIVYFGGRAKEAGLILRQMREQGIRTPMMASDGINSPEFAQIAGRAAEGTLMTMPPDLTKEPSARDVLARIRARNHTPGVYTLYSYAAVQVLADAAQRAGIAEGKKVAEVLKTGRPFDTVIGNISYDRKGDVTRPDYIVAVWRLDSSGNVSPEGHDRGGCDAGEQRCPDKKCRKVCP